MPLSINIDFERKLFSRGELIAGVDEVGRGAIAGPLVVGCVGFSSDVRIPSSLYIHDSKKLTQKNRNEAYIWIIENSLFYGLGKVDNTYIDSNGIMEALYRAKQISLDRARYVLARKASNAEINKVIIDGNDKQILNGLPESSQLNIIRGDAQVFSTACASIVAKVHRDALMHTYSLLPRFRVYDWSRNKGYGTKSHIDAIRRYGTSTLHRRQFVRKCVSE